MKIRILGVKKILVTGDREKELKFSLPVTPKSCSVHIRVSIQKEKLAVFSGARTVGFGKMFQHRNTLIERRGAELTNPSHHKDMVFVFFSQIVLAHKRQ